MSKVLLASIYPLRVGITRPFVPIGEFYIDAVEKGEKPKTLLIENQTQRGTDLTSGRRRDDTIEAVDIAHDFIVHTTLSQPGTNPACRPGLWICASLDGPSKEEEQINRICQNAWWDVQMGEGNRYALKPETLGLVTGPSGMLFRLAAVQLGRKPAWLNPPSDMDTMNCQYCGELINTGVAVCSKCGNVANFERWKELEQQKKVAKQQLTAA